MSNAIPFRLDRATAPAVALPHTEQFDVASNTGRQYRIFIGVPEGPAPEQGWPVIYHTDGNDNFPIVLAAAQKQNRGQLRALIVGIGCPSDNREQHRLRRAFDLTVPASRQWVEANARRMATAEFGGCAEFLEFIRKDVKPAIERAYPVDTSRQTLLGHSFGGLFVLYALFERPAYFQTYVALSPSIWWSDGDILNAEAAFCDRQRTNAPKPLRLFVGVGQLEQQPASGDTKERAELRIKRRMVDNSQEQCERLRSSKVNLDIHHVVIEGANHGTVVLPGIARGMAFAFEQ